MKRSSRHRLFDGARYFRATNADKLKEMYKEIDALEKTEFNVCGTSANPKRPRAGLCSPFSDWPLNFCFVPPSSNLWHDEAMGLPRPALRLVVFIEFLLWIAVIASWIAANHSSPA